jgi:hypothetical protein
MPADTKSPMSRIVVKQSFVLLLDICFNFFLFPVSGIAADGDGQNDSARLRRKVKIEK